MAIPNEWSPSVGKDQPGHVSPELSGSKRSHTGFQLSFEESNLRKLELIKNLRNAEREGPNSGKIPEMDNLRPVSQVS